MTEAQSTSMSDIAERMVAKRAGSYILLQRFQAKLDLKQVLLRLYQEEAKFVIGNPTEMERFRPRKHIM
jgi:hypothetical protein